MYNKLLLVKQLDGCDKNQYDASLWLVFNKTQSEEHYAIYVE